MDKHTTRQLILREALFIAPFEGWNESMMVRAASRASLSAIDVSRCFQTPQELLAFWMQQADAATSAYAAETNLTSLKIRERIAALVMFRLRYFLPHREAFRRAQHVLLMPWNIPLNTSLLMHSMDHIWRLAGDASTDYNWYSKRLLLAGVYGSTVMFWLNDTSADLEHTQQFLARRIAEVLKLGGAISSITKRIA